MLELNLNNFQAEALEADQPVLVDFWAPLVRLLPPAGPRSGAAGAGTGGRVTVAKLNVDDAQVLAQKYEVETIPTLILFRGRAGQRAAHQPGPQSGDPEWLKGQGAIED